MNCFVYKGLNSSEVRWDFQPCSGSWAIASPFELNRSLFVETRKGAPEKVILCALRTKMGPPQLKSKGSVFITDGVGCLTWGKLPGPCPSHVEGLTPRLLSLTNIDSLHTDIHCH